MATYQDYIAQFLAPQKRASFDYKISIMGTETKVIRFKVTENKYREKEYTLLNDDTIPFIVKTPEKIPLTRLRKKTELGMEQKVDASTQNMFLYDLLPLEGWSRFTDDVEKGDIIIKRMFADDDDDDPYMLVLRVTETLGNIDQDQMVWKVHNLAPYTNAIPPATIAAIDAFKNAWKN